MDKEILTFLSEEGLEVYKLLDSKGHTTDESLSDETGIHLNTVRKFLYKMYDLKWAEYERVKDKKIGWYVYEWSLTDKAPTRKDNKQV